MSDLAGTRQPHPHVLSTIPGVTLRAGAMSVKARLHTVVITPEQILFIRATSAELKRVSAYLREEYNDTDGGRIGRLGAERRAQEVLAQECAALDPADLLSSHDKNFAIDRTTVTTVKIVNAESARDDSENRLTIKTTGKVYKTHLTGTSIEQARDALSDAGLI